MKYLLLILLFCIAAIPFFIWESLISIWLFRTDKLKKLWKEFSETIWYNYRRAFPYKPNRSQKTRTI